VLVAALANHPRGLDRVGKVFAMTKGSRLYNRLERAAEAAGVAIPDGVAFHALRHTWASLMRRYGGLDTTGLVATGAWLSADAARRYEHAVASEEAQRADLLPVIGRKP
jgi:integrase